MAAESLPFSFGTVSSWELEAWYEDLQEVLSSDENGGTYISLPGNEEEESKTFTTLDPASLAWLTGGARTSRGHKHLPQPSFFSRLQSELPGTGGRGRRPKKNQEAETKYPVPSPGWEATHEGKRTGE
jgi:DNA damage-inducible transcript 3